MAHPWEDRWDIVQPLSRGGQGVTKLVMSKSAPQQKGVLKYLVNNKSSTARARMRREVANLQSLATLGGKVPQVLEHNTEAYNEPKIELYLVMEHIEGPTLKEFVESQGKLTVDQALDFTLALCDTVRIAHTEGILHRDIKPDNIIVKNDSGCELYIVDYGLSFNADDEDLTETVETFRNKFLDLPETNAPGGDRRDPRSDVTALCALLYYMLTGHHPGHLQDASGKMPHLRPGYTVREAIAPDPRQIQVELLLSRGLALPLQRRFQDVDEFTSRLKTLREQVSAQTTSDPIATAKELSAQIREQDRKTQLAEFRPIATGLLNKFAHNVNQLGKQLGRFKCTFGPGRGKSSDLDVDFDILTAPYTATVSVDHHPSKRIRTYIVASRAEQSVVCVCDYDFHSEPSKPIPLDWKELAWYEGTPTEVIATLEAEFMEWLDISLQQIAREIISG